MSPLCPQLLMDDSCLPLSVLICVLNEAADLLPGCLWLDLGCAYNIDPRQVLRLSSNSRKWRRAEGAVNRATIFDIVALRLPLP